MKMRAVHMLMLGVIAMGLAAGAAQAQISYYPITDDTDSDISSTKTYTHAIDFGTQAGSGGSPATINGVVFADGNGGAFPAIGGSSQTVGTGNTTIPTDHVGDANANTTGGMENLVHDMVYNDTTAVITLTGLTPGQPYRFRLYNRQWGTTAGTSRGQNIGFDTDGVGTGISGAEDTATFQADDATKPDPSQATFNQVYALTYDYTLSAGVTTLTVYINATSTGSYHLYGLTNEQAGPDTTAPSISTLSPTNNATGVAVNANLVATFNEAIKTNTTGSIVITNLSDNTSMTIAIGDSSQITVSGATLTINPTANLAYSTDYQVLIDTNAIKDTAGNFYTNVTAWGFRTADPDLTPPVITGKSPDDNDTEVSASSSIVATFDEDILEGTGNVTLYNVTLGANGPVIDVTDGTQVSIVNNVMTINPTDDLSVNTVYAVQMDPGVVKNLADLDFGGIPDTTTWNFQTESVILASTFDGVDTTGAGPNPTATSITWDTVAGIVEPAGSLTFNGAGGFYNLAGFTENEICVADNLPTWSTSINMVVLPSVETIDLQSLDFNWRVAGNGGGNNTAQSKSDTWTVEIVGSSSGSLGTPSIGPAAPGSPVQFRSIDLTGFPSLTPTETYTLTLSIVGTGFGHNASLQDFTLKGVVTFAPPAGTVFFIR